MTIMIHKDEKSLIWQPAHRKYCHHDNEHLYHLQQIKERNIKTKIVIRSFNGGNFDEFEIH